MSQLDDNDNWLTTVMSRLIICGTDIDFRQINLTQPE